MNNSEEKTKNRLTPEDLAPRKVAPIHGVKRWLRQTITDPKLVVPEVVVMEFLSPCSKVVRIMKETQGLHPIRANELLKNKMVEFQHGTSTVKLELLDELPTGKWTKYVSFRSR